MSDAIRKGDRVKVARVHPEDDVVRERTACFLGWVGMVKDGPNWLEKEPEKGPLGNIVAEGECLVEFDQSCSKHGDNWGVFTVSELEKA